ncbi:MAG: sensor domain-containing diguanylate cyclase [Pseudomonadota bacterium]
MSFSATFRRVTTVLVFLLSAAFVYAAYSAINNIVAEQSRLQQQALSPVYKLVRDELLRPFYIAETFATSVDFTAVMSDRNFDEAALLSHLEQMEQDLDLVFFVASESKRKQYFSSGRVIELIEGEVAWYFEALEQDTDFMADLGQIGDVHLYFDVKMYGGDGEFAGIVGVGKRIQRFLDTFNEYKAQYGYDFLFVNDRNEIILSSLPDLVVTDAYIPTLEALDWFATESLAGGSLDSELIRVDNQDFLISEFGIEELDWQLLLLVPLEARQSQITSSFATNMFAAFVIAALLAAAALLLMFAYKRGLEQKTEVDSLSGLPNRTYIQRHFERLRRDAKDLCVILIDLDHFKGVNDSHGHAAGDEVIKETAVALRNALRDVDIVGRWGGEEFLMLVPSRSVAQGITIAERARADLEDLQFDIDGKQISVTASFGVAFGSARSEALSDLLARADDALYAAKEGGRNQVRSSI